jgi:hypothetical protein
VDRQRKARDLDDGRVEFAPNRRAVWAWGLLLLYLIYATVIQLKTSHGRPLNLTALGILTLVIVFSFPYTIIVTADGLQQIAWLRIKKQICWTDIVEINTGERSRTVTMTAADGTKIIHSSQLPDRPRLLIELKQHCGDNLPPDFPREPIADF